jgi:hypothetical protein
MLSNLLKHKLQKFTIRYVPVKYRQIIFNKKLSLGYILPDYTRRTKTTDFPRILQIETHSYCNGFCTCCPYGKVKVSMGKMSWSMYKKVIDEASNYKVDRISLYLNNEPTLDMELVKKIEYAKSKCPIANIHISTNASLLTEIVSLGLVNHLDSITISVQGGPIKEKYEKCMVGLNFERCMKNIDFMLSLVNSGKYNLKIQNVLISNVIRDKSTIDFQRNYWKKRGIKFPDFGRYTSRASFLQKEKISKKKNIRGCALGQIPLNHINIIYNGDVLLCCMDWKREIILGNVGKQSIYEIWHSKAYEDIRDVIYNKKETNSNFLCNRCEHAMK